ncbi:DUF2767 family protein, partial [Escherichia coli]
VSWQHHPALANKRIQRSELEKQAMETVINALVK